MWFPPRFAPFVLVLLLGAPALLAGCSAGHRLAEVSLAGEAVAVVAAIPPRPRVQAGSPVEGFVDFRDPVGTAARVSSAAVKYRQARRAQARLDSTVGLVDIGDRIARQALVRSADLLGFTPSNDVRGARYLLDLRINDYALVADSFEGATFFILDAEAVLRDRVTGERLWRERVREREVLDAAWFGMPVPIGNVVTGRQLAALSAAEMAAGLQALADHTAERITATLERDYARSREAYARRTTPPDSE